MIKKIKAIREKTGAGVIDIKKALEEAEGNQEKAIKILKRKGLEKAGKKIDRSTAEGIIGFYIHSNNKIAALVEVFCETDFVARNNEFKELAKDLAMQIAAMNPLAVLPEEVPNDLIKEMKKDWKKELQKEKKSLDLIEKIIQGKELKVRKEKSLLGQVFIKDQNKTVEEYVKEKISKLGENIKVGKFIRMEM